MFSFTVSTGEAKKEDAMKKIAKETQAEVKKLDKERR